MLNAKKIKKEFPIFANNSNLVYLDSAATSLKPQVVINKVVEYYEKYGANVARGLYKISEKATAEFEETRSVVAKFINAKPSDEIVFTHSATESINLIAYSTGREIVKEGDEIVTTIMEHHSNFVPWQLLAFEVGADFKVIDITDDDFLSVILSETKDPSQMRENTHSGEILRSAQNDKHIDLKSIISKKTKILALTYVSNVLGTINPVKEIIAAARKISPEIIVIVDAAQAVPHMKVDVQDLDADFLVFSSHKMLGPTGVGVMWGRYKLLESIFPFNFGGEMIEEVFVDKTTFKKPPHKFEAGTPHIDGVIALKTAIQYLNSIGMDKVRAHEMQLTKHTLEKLKKEFGEKINIFGPKEVVNHGGVIAFTFGSLHPHDIAQILDEDNICLRAGHHCAMPLHTRLGVSATSRASFYIYNDEEDVEKLIEGLKKVEKMLGN